MVGIFHIRSTDDYMPLNDSLLIRKHGQDALAEDGAF